MTYLYVYILNCGNGAYYTGCTTDLMRRYHEHTVGTIKCKYTRSFKPIGIAQCWQVFGDKGDAMKIELFIKRMSKKEKAELILFPENLVKLFHCKPAKEFFNVKE